MAGLGRHLLARHQRDAVHRRRGGQLRVVADRVVVSDRQEVQAPASGEPGQLGHGHHAVGVDGVGVQVAGQPAAARACGQARCGGLSARGGTGRAARPGPAHPACWTPRPSACNQRPRAAPGAGRSSPARYPLEFAGQVPGRRGSIGDDGRPACPSGPAAEAGRPMQPRSMMAPERSYSSSARTPHVPAGTSNGR